MTNTNNFDLAAALETLRTTDRPALDKLLLESAAVGNDAAVDALLEAGGSTEAKNREGCTALHLAAWHGHASTAERLIAQSARIDIDAPDKFGWTPLHFAARYGQTETAALLIAMGASTGAKNDIGKTPL